MEPDTDSDNTQSQQILVSFWGVLMAVLFILTLGVLYIHYKNNKMLRKKLYNFKKAPKNYI
jgi:hypothetical protein